MPGDEVLNHRKDKFLKIGRSKGFVSQLDDISTLSMKKNQINIIIEKFFKFKNNIIIFSVAFLLIISFVYFL